jgi:hypothetical protein
MTREKAVDTVLMLSRGCRRAGCWWHRRRQAAREVTWDDAARGPSRRGGRPPRSRSPSDEGVGTPDLGPLPAEGVGTLYAYSAECGLGSAGTYSGFCERNCYPYGCYGY